MKASSPPPIPLLLLVVLSVVLAATPAAAQVEATPTLEGQVRLGEQAGGGSPLDIASETVVLHRVTADTAGAVDSVRAAQDGRFSFALPSVPDPGGRGDIYFASVEHQGIMYFGDAVTTAMQLDSLYVIEVHDTTHAPAGGARMPVAIRYVVLEPGGASDGTPDAPDGGWRVTDLIQVLNDGTRTVVAPEGGPVWTYPLPAEARRPRIGAGDTGPDASRMEDGRLRVDAPIPPGQRQFIVRYSLTSPEVTFLLPGRTEQIELLIREPAPPLRVEGLDAGEPVDMGTGTTYRRYAGTALQDTEVRVSPGEEGSGVQISPRWVAVVLALLLGGVGVWAAMRRPGRVGRTGRDGGPVPGGAASSGEPSEPGQQGALAGDERKALLLEVARIDERLEGGVADEAEEARLRARRSELVERLEAGG